jgi:two-component system response regulator DesR
MVNKQSLAKLGSRELEVVTELLNGNRVQAIARKLYLSPGTVRNHLSTAYRKLGVTNQQELIDLLRDANPTDV